MNLPMSWDEWADHDGVALAARVAKGELTAAELAAQAAAGIAKVDPALSAVVEIFEDAVTDPGTGRHRARRAVCRTSVPDEGSRPDDAGPPAGNGLADDARQPRHGRHVHDDEDARGRAQSDRPHHHAGIRGLQFRGQSRRLRHAQSLEYRLHHLRLVRRQRRDGRRRHGADRACDRRRRLDPDSRRRQRQYRAEGLARRVLAGAASVRPQRAGLDPGLPVAHGARHRGLRRRLPRSGAGRIHAVLESAGALYADDRARSGPAENRAVVQVGRLPRDAAYRGRTAKGRALPRRPRPSRRLRPARAGLSRSLRGADHLLHQQFCDRHRQHARRARAEAAAGRSDRTGQRADLGGVAGT